MRKTKIVCTIGPACSDEETLTKMCLAGMNVARLNFSHGSYDDHLARILQIKRVREKLNLPVAILLDTKAPSTASKHLRTGKLPCARATASFLRPKRLRGIRPAFPSAIKG